MKCNDLSAVAHSYLRFSKKKQEEGDSARRQTALRDAWLKRNPKVRFDASLVFEDRGVTGFDARRRKNLNCALAQFLDLVERGKVLPGSYLIVENLDRLSREEELDALPFVLDLIRAGIKIVQLAPFEAVYEAGMPSHMYFTLVQELSRGHGESKRKSGNLLQTFAAKKQRAREGIVKGGSSLPAWIELDEAYRIIPEAGRAVRLIFRLCVEGMGTLAIARRLNSEGIPPIGRADKWWRSYVAKILNSRTTFGEYQPMTGKNGTVADGEPIPGYYPAVIKEAEFHAAHAAVQARNKRSGRPASKGDYVGPFSGLLRCAIDRGPLHIKKQRGKRTLISARANNAEPGAYWCPFPLESFNDGLLSQLVELQASDLFSDPGGSKLAELNGRLIDVKKRLKVAVERFDADPESPTWADRVSQYDREQRAVLKELKDAELEAANPLSAVWEDAVSLMAEKEPIRLRAALLQTVEEIWCVFERNGRNAVAAVQVFFKGGSHRLYTLYHDFGYTLPTAKKDPHWLARSIKREPGKGHTDLRKEKDARRWQGYLRQGEA